jgi:hypothetical protein
MTVIALWFQNDGNPSQPDLYAVRAINSGLARGFTAPCIRSELLDTPGGHCWTPTAVCQ